MSSWQQFFLVRLPIAAAMIELVVELAGYFLSGVPLHRHNVDDLAAAVIQDQQPYRAVLLGDSITHNVSHKFRIGGPDEVADLTTHAFAGLPSSMFLLKRYLESGHRPRLVLLASSRDVFILPIAHDTFRLYVQSVFTQQFERQFLQRYYPTDVDYRWKPAALSVESKVFEPLFSLLRHPKNEIWLAPDMPQPEPKLESFSNDSDDPEVFAHRVATPYELRPEAKAVITEICRLAREYHFSFHLVWAPMEPKLRSALTAKGSLQQLDTQISQVLSECGVPVEIGDSSSKQAYPYFDRNLIHIKGTGWEQTYANELGDYIREFESMGGEAQQTKMTRQSVSPHSPP